MALRYEQEKAGYYDQLGWFLQDTFRVRPKYIDPSGKVTGREYAAAALLRLQDVAEGNPSQTLILDALTSLSPNLADFMISHVANNKYTIDDTARKLALSPGQAKIRYMFARHALKENDALNIYLTKAGLPIVGDLHAELGILAKQHGVQTVLDESLTIQAPEAIDIILEAGSRMVIRETGLERHLRPFDEYVPDALIYYAWQPKKVRHTALGEYKAYALGAYVYKQSTRSVKAMRQAIRAYYPEVRTDPTGWFRQGIPNGKLPALVSDVETYRSRNPEGFNRENASQFFENGMMQLLTGCILNAGTGKSGKGFAGFTESNMYHIGGEAAEACLDIDQTLTALGIGRYVEKRGMYQITNVYITRFLECFNEPKTAIAALNQLPEHLRIDFLTTFLEESIRTHGVNIPSSNVSPAHTRVLLSAKTANRQAVFQWIAHQLADSVYKVKIHTKKDEDMLAIDLTDIPKTYTAIRNTHSHRAEQVPFERRVLNAIGI